MPTRIAIGASSPISLKCSSALRDRCMLTIPMGVDLEQSLYALDSTTIDLCLSLFPWARFRKESEIASR